MKREWIVAIVAAIIQKNNPASPQHCLEVADILVGLAEGKFEVKGK